MDAWTRWNQGPVPARILRRPGHFVRAEIVVVGSGPGGAVTACALAEAGRDVLLVEEGPYLAPDECRPFSLDEMTQKYRNGGLTVALGPAKVAYVEGRCVGGGSEVNSGIYHRIPAEVLDDWRRDYQVDCLGEEDLLPHYEACEEDLSVSLEPGGRVSEASRLLHAGAQQLGWRSLESPRCYHYDSKPEDVPQAPRSESSGSPVPRGVKQSMTRTYIPRALRAGCRLLPDTRVHRFHSERRHWLLRARHARAPIEIEADTLFLAAGAIQTPTLLRRSGITRNIGDNLRLHPTLKVVARFAHEVSDEAMAVPVHQVKEFAPTLTFGCSLSTLPYLALAMNEHPGNACAIEHEPGKAAVYYVMVSGAGRGRVRPLPFFQDPLVSYRIAPEDLHDLSEGLRNLCRLLLRAGASSLYPSLPGFPAITKEADLDRLPAVSGRSGLMTIHLFSTCPMGENRRDCATDSFGRVHGFDNLYVADASLLCTSPSVNPQGGIMVLARRNALAWVRKSC
jgi:choline dehydrogenase-like flavoprotein